MFEVSQFSGYVRSLHSSQGPRRPAGGLRLALGLALLVAAAPAAAVVDVNKSFVPINVVPGQTSTMTISLFNSVTTAATGVAFTDSLPANMTALSIVSNTCGVTPSIVPNTAVSLIGGTIPAGDGTNSGVCNITVTVTSTTPGTWTNTIPAGAVTSSQPPNPQAASATLTVAPTLPITGTKAFSTTHLHPGGVSDITITLTNPNTFLPLTNVTFTDTLPAPLEIDSPVVTGGTCGGTFTDGAGTSLDPADTSFRTTGGSLPAGGSCTVTVRVRVPASAATTAPARNGNVTNSIGAGAVTTAQGVTNPAFSRQIIIQSGAEIGKAFSPSPVLLGGASTLTLTLRNFNLADITNTTFTDTMPGGITVVGPATTTCAGGTPSFTANSVTLTGGTIPAATSATAASFGSCTITVPVTGDQLGALLNSVPASNLGGVPFNAASGTLQVNLPVGSVTAAKAFSPSTIVQGGTSTLTITLSNAAGLNAAITSFTDDLNTMGAGYTVGSSPAASTTCGGALTAVPGTTPITLVGGTIPAGGNCTITVPVTAAVNAVPGGRTNRILAGGLVTDLGSNINPSTATLTTNRAATVGKAFSPTPILPGGISRLTITITHANGAPAFTNMGLTDPLTSMGVGFVVAAAPNAFNNCGGTFAPAAGATSLTLSGGSLGTGATSCQIRVDVQAPLGTGTSTNTIPANALTTAEGFTDEAARTANLVRQAAPGVVLNKAFVPNVANGGSPVVAQVTIANNQPLAVALTNVSLTDVLPPNVEVHTVPNPSFTGSGCSGATITAVPQSNQFSIAGASIAANSTCTLSVTVTAFVDGNHINDIPVGTLASAQGVTNSNNPSATLTIARNVNIGKSFSPSTIEAGGTSTLTIRLFNTNTVVRTLDSPGLVDTLPAGVTVAGAASSTCSGANVTTTATTVTVSDAVLAATSACNVTVPVTAAATGAYTNIIPANALDTLEGSTNPDPATAILTVVAKPTITKVFSPSSIPAGSTSTITFTLANPNNATLLPGGLTGATFTDTLSGMAISANQVAGGSCVGFGSNSFTTGQTALTFSGLTLPPSPATCNVTVVVTAAVAGTYPNLTSGVLTNQTQTAGTPSSTVNLTVLDGPPTIAKSFSPDPISGGGASVLTFTLTNPNSVAVTLASPAFSDVFPTTPGAMTVAAPLTTTNTCGGTLNDSGNGALAAGDVGIRYNNGSIPSNSSCTVSVAVTAGVPGVYGNTSSLLSSTNAGTSLLPATDTLTVQAQADLSLTKTASNPTPLVGSVVTFTVSVTNAGPAPTGGVTVSDPLPAGYAFVSATASSGSFDSGTGVWTVGTIGVGTTATLSIQMTVGLTGPYGTNTAQVTASSLPDPDSTPGNGNPAEDDQASVTPSPVPAADLSITKTDGVASIAPGSPLTYTIVASNSGPLAVTGATVADTFPATLTGVTWTCVAAGGGSCTASGSGNISDTVNLPVGATATYTVTATVSPIATGTLANTATVTAPGGITDPTPANNSATDADTLTPAADLGILKTDGSGTYAPGQAISYTITVTNNGPSTVTSLTVTDAVPASITSPVFSPSAGAYTAATGAWTGLNLAAGQSVTLTLSGTVSASATGNLVNTATVAPPAGTTDPTPGNDTSTDTDTFAPSADLGILKTDGSGTYAPGQAISYTITVTNNGPSTVTSLTVTDAVPASITSPVFSPSAGAYTAATGAWTGLNLAAGQSVTLTLSGTVSASATGNLVNTATVAPPAGTTDPTPGNDTSTDTDTFAPSADLGILKTDGSGTYAPGQAISYTITVTNNGPSTVTSLTVTDAVPASITSPVFSPSAGAYTAATGAWTGLNLAAGQSVTLTLSGTVSASATGNLVNTATVAPPAGTTDPTPGNDTSTDTDTFAPSADLGILKTDGSGTYAPGQAISYTITVTNNGPSTVTSLTVTDAVPASITSPVFSPSAGAYTAATGAWTGLNLAAGQSVTLTLSGTVSASATGNLVNTATVAPPAGTTDPTPGNDTSTDTDTFAPSADLGILKTDGSGTYAPGQAISYTITVTNNGPSTVTSLTVTDAVPASITSPVFSPSAGAYTAATGAWTGLNLAAGQSVTLTLSGTVSASATGNLVNTATVAPPAGTTDPTPGNDTSTDTDTFAPSADLGILKTDGSGTYAPGQAISYTITVTNNGPSTVTSLTVTDAVPASITSPVFSPSAGAYTAATGAWTGLNLAAGQSVTLTLSGTVSASATGNLVNTATVAPPAGTTDPTPGNDTATDTDTFAPSADLGILKTDGSGTYAPGQAISYTITVTNNGPSTVTSLTVTDAVPASITSPVFSPSAGAYTAATGAWTGLNLAAGQSVTLTLSGTVSASATGNLVNTATVAPPAGTTDPTPGNDTSTDTDTFAPSADLGILKTDGSGTYAPGQAISYTITVTNNGPSTVTSLTVTDAVPASITSPVFSPSAGAYTAATGAWTGLNLAAGQSVTLTLSGTVSASATGNLVNTATVAPPAGTTDPTPGNDTSTDTDTFAPSADLGILKTDGSGTYAPGQAISYTITVTNNGPSTVTSLTVTDAVPASITSPVFSPSAGAYTAATGAWTGLNLAAGQSVTLTLSGTVSASATGNLVNTATVAPPAGTTDPTPGNDTSTDTDTFAPSADLGILKTDGSGTYAPGQAISYTITVTNNGPSTVTSLTVTDAVPASITSPVFSPSAGAYTAATGAWTGLNLAAGQSVTLTLSGTVSASATGNLVNTVTVAPPAGTTDPTPGNDTATDTDTAAPIADLYVTKSGPGSTTAGSNVTFNLLVGNSGPSDATGVTVTDPTPGGLVFVSASAPCAAGFPCTIGNLASGATVSLSVVYSVPAGYLAPDPIVNTASVAGNEPDPDPADNTSTSSTAVGRTPSADLAIVKSGPATASAGSTVTYSIVMTNNGPDDAAGVSLTDPTPSGLTFTSASAPCAAGFPCALGTLNAGASITVSVTFSVPGGYSSPDPIVNVASVSSTTSDPNPANNSSSASTALGADPVDLSVLKSGPASVTAGNDITWNLVIRNAGPATATGVQLADPTPAGLSFVSASAPCAGGFPCALGSLAPGASLALTATFNVPVSYSGSNPVLNTATVTSAEPDANPADNTSTASTGVGVDSADLAVVKTGPALAVAGENVTYQVTVRNLGPGTAQGVFLADPTPVGLSFVSSSAPCAGGFPCSLGSIAAGSSVTVAATFAVPGGYTTPNPILNTATVNSTTLDGNPANDSSTVTTPLGSVADLSILKTDGSGTYTPGLAISYTITVTNAGPTTVTSLTVIDAVPASITGPVFTPSTGSYNPGTGTWTGLNLASGQSITLTLSGTVSAAATGNLVNTVTVAPTAGTTDPTPGNNTATDTDTNSPSADLTATKTDGSTTYTPGGTAVYTIVVTNAGPSNVTGATVADALPTGITTAAWTCTASAGSTCAATGTGAIADTVNLLTSGTATYTLTLTIPAGRTGDLVNTVTVTAPAGTTDPTPGNNTATDTDTNSPSADLTVTKTDGTTAYVPGATAVYTIVVSNAGPSDATGATVADALPTGITTAAWTCTASAGSTCAATGTGAIADTVNVLASGTLTYTLTLTIPAGRTGDLVNTVTVTAPAGVTDPTPGNNTATDTDTVSAQADLVVTKVASSATVPVGTDFHYTITVRNLGPSNATNVVMTDPLPSGLLFVSASTTRGSCSGTATVTCALGVLAPNAQTEVLLTVRAMSPGAFLNTATATLNESDPTPPNNVATAPVDAQGQATIPTASEAGLLTLALLIAAAGMLLLRRAFPVG